VHDAAGVSLGGSGYVFGGGSPTTVAENQRLSESAGSATFSAGVVGSLPQPRSDAVAVTVGHAAYVLGGYDGSNPDPQVLRTVDGKAFSVVTNLPVPVRYPAVGVLNGKIYLFGGEATGGKADGRAVTAIQMVDPGAHRAAVVGHLPGPVAGAAAFVLAGHLYIAGGTSGEGSSVASSAAGTGIWAFDPGRFRVLRAGTLPTAVSFAGVTVSGSRAWLIGGEDQGTVLSSVEMVTPNSGFGTAGASGAGSPYFGMKLLIADRGNNRLLLVDSTNALLWTYPSVYAAPPPGGFYFPDDAFFAKKGTEIISNQEMNETIVIIAFPSGKVLWQYGRPLVKSAAPGFLHTPDDAYLLKNGQVTIADASNCRVLFINPDKTIANQIGTNGACTHQPPNFLGSPNGDTPLADGNVLISEINGSWVSEYTPSGHLVWTVQLPVGYPSDAQQIGPDLYLISDYSQPGAIVEFTREGKIVYRYQPTSGSGELNQPSLTELLPSGVFMTNDDYRNRMVAIDPATQALVWQYGVTDAAGTAAGMLNTPDGFDVLLPDGSTPTHLPTQ
jgi:outer membrane protein assembly factor BamB